MRKITITITPAEFDALHRLCELSGLGFAELIRRAIDQYVSAPDVLLPLAEEEAS